jgi:hypothetical protein
LERTIFDSLPSPAEPLRAETLIDSLDWANNEAAPLALVMDNHGFYLKLVVLIKNDRVRLNHGSLAILTNSVVGKLEDASIRQHQSAIFSSAVNGFL